MDTGPDEDLDPATGTFMVDVSFPPTHLRCLIFLSLLTLFFLRVCLCCG